jgi:hypothetical protein
LSTPCIRANNLNDGKAFNLQVTNGNLGGVIQKTNDIRAQFPNSVPFITNMGGIALGLNSDRLDNLHAEQIITEAVERATGGGGDAPNGGGGGGGEACPEGTTAAGGGCLETAPRAAADYAAASRTCAQAGRRLAPADVLLAAAAAAGIDLGDGEVSGDVTTILPADLNEPLSPLTDLLETLELPLVGDLLDAPVPDLDPLTITGSYTRVNDAGSLAASNLSATAPPTAASSSSP